MKQHHTRPMEPGPATANSMPATHSGASRQPFSNDSSTVNLLTGDAEQVLATLPANSADCVVTSPPYWRLRDYATGTWSGGSPDCPHPANAVVKIAVQTANTPRCCTSCGASWTDGQYGLESTADAYVTQLRKVFAELRRVLSPTGTAWLNLGDSYATNSDGYWCTRPGQYRQPRYRPAADVPHKNLLGMPWRVALALQSDGWILRNAIVWHKANAAPFPVRDRLSCHYETIFLLVQQPYYYFDLDPIRQPYTGDRSPSRRAHRGGNKPHTARGIWPPPADDDRAVRTARGRNPGDVWSVPVTPRRHQAHPAAFPIEIPRRCIAAGCPPGGVVLDPFSGTGTTGLAARQLGRSYIGIDLNAAFQAGATARLARQVCCPGAATPVGKEETA
ncbi:DNA-methyltransferase [Streptantibioticus ferralitis]|uniref:Methyltransferase n=1 Tax=Streptantibioticus ferralitis TaxID=236510 RepID=A0ABT5Z3D6_9ACTN|nr:site-specific DNA-methyltransferase [Streptantibioticus ferralitis]MDF2258335.1 site-specific DNA-methyltransferase [Streptantibioticus ferralitis]